MSVRDEITRLETAKSDIEAAIETCGVNVPDTEKISAYASYIRQIPSAVFSELNADKVGGTDKFIQTIEQVDGVIEATAGGLVSSSLSGLTPKIGTDAAATIGTQSDEWVLTSTKGAQPTWRMLPANAFKNDNSNTTYTLSGTLNNNTFVSTLTPSSGNATTSTVPAMIGASSSAAGKAGLVPAPAKNNEGKFLRGDGTWAIPSKSENSYYLYTQYQNSTDFYPNYKAYLKWIANDVAAFHFTDGTYKFKADLADSVPWSGVTDKPTKLSDFTDDILANYYLPLSGGQLTGNLTLYTASGNSPYLKFRRGSDKTDNLCDWTIVDEGGYLIFREEVNGNTKDVLKMCGSVGSVEFSGTVSGTFNGSLTGTATYATYLGDKTNNYTYSSLSTALSDKYSYATSRTKNTVLAAPNGSNGSATFRALVAADLPAHNHNSSQITALTNYSKATTAAAIAATDSLNTALGKLELKADTAYTLTVGAYDGDGTIENLAEILKVLEGISDTDTIQAIIGKYLPLAGGSLSSDAYITWTDRGAWNNPSATYPYSYGGLKWNGTSDWIKVYGREEGSDKLNLFIEFGDDAGHEIKLVDNGTAHTVLHSGIAGISDGTITINGTSITPLTSHQHIPDYTLRASTSTVGKLYLQKDGSDYSNITITLPSTLKNPNAIKFKKTDGTSVSYDGSSALDLEAGINYATHSASASTLSGGTIATWGTLTAGNGYANVCTWDTGNTTGAFSLAGKGGQMSLQLDGFFYQNEGKYLVLDSNNYATYADSRYAKGNYASQSELSDCNKVSSTGFWTHSGFSNRPTDVKDWGSLMNIRLYDSNNNYHRQLFFDCYGSDYVWTRSDVGGTWTSWKRLALVSDIPTKTSQLDNDSGYITSYTDTAAGKTFKTGITTATHSGWDNTTNQDKIIPTMNFIAYWNGAYNGNGSSNLAYCANGTILGSNNYTSYVNETNFPGINKTGTVTSVATGTGLTGGTITSSGTISINSDYQTYISNGNTAYGWGNHASAKYMKAVGRHSGSMDLNKVDSTMSVVTEIRPSEITTTNLPSDYGTAYGCMISARDGNSNYGHGKMQILGCNKKFWMRATQGAGEANDGTWCRLALTSDLKNPSDYYWANIKVSDTSSTDTSPTFANATTTGLLTVSTGGSHCGIKVGDTYINSISGNLIFQNNSAIRFGGDSWDYDVWAGLKYVHSSKTIYLGLADNNAFTANSAQSGGTVTFPGVSALSLTSGSRIHANGGNLYLGNSNNAGWLMLQDVCSQSGNTYWHIYNGGAAKFGQITSTVANGTAPFVTSSTTKVSNWNADMVDGFHIYERNLGVNGTNWTFASMYNTATTTIYAPTSVGTSGYVLKSNGSGAPSWVAQSTLSVGSATTATNASNVYINTSGTSSYYPVPFVTSTGAGNKALYIDNSTGTAAASNGIRYNPSTNALYSSGGFYESSDERLKTILSPVKVDLEELSKLRKVYYLWKDGTKDRQLGAIAQDVQKLYPELVHSNADTGYLSLAYDKLSVVALAAIDELYDMIKTLRKENEELKSLLSK